MSTPLLVGACVALTLTAQSAAGTEIRTLTGKDLLDDPAVSFPTTEPSVDGKSLVFGPGVGAFEKLIAVPVVPGGSYGRSQLPLTLSALMKLTRLDCVNECDFEPWIGFSDGTHIVGVHTAADASGQGFTFELTDEGSVGRNPESDLLFAGAGYPEIGESLAVLVRLILDATGAAVELSYLGGSGRATSDVTLDLTRDISLLLLRGASGDQYQLDTVTVSVAPNRYFGDVSPGDRPD